MDAGYELSGCSLNGGAGECGTQTVRAAGWNGHVDVVEVLLKADADVNKAVHVHKVSLNSKRRTALIMASDRGHRAVVRMLLQGSADDNKNDGSTAHIEANKRGHVDVALVKTLLIITSRGPEAEGEHPLAVRMLSGCQQAINKLSREKMFFAQHTFSRVNKPKY